MKADWRSLTLGQVAEVVAGQSPEGKFYNNAGAGTPFYQGKKEFCDKFIGPPTTWTTRRTKIAQLGDVLMSVRAPVGPVNFATQEICIGRGLAAIRSGNLLDRWFLLYCLLSLQDQIAGSDGAVFASINKTEIEQIPLLVPPLPEQRRIVGILDEAFEGIATARANAEKNVQNAGEIFECRLNALVSPVSSGWADMTVQECVIEGILRKPFDGNHGEIHPKASDYAESGVPFVMACDLRSGGVDTVGCKFIPRKLADRLRVGFAKHGDVLLSHKGTVGRSAVLGTTYDYVMLTPQVTAYRVADPGRLENRFLRYYFMGTQFQEELASAAGGGSTRAYVGITKQRELRIRFPALVTQQRAISTLDALTPEIERLSATYQQKLAALDELKKSLLHRAFSGQL